MIRNDVSIPSFSSKALLLVLSIFLVSACAASKEEFQNRSCNRETGYEHGMNAGRENKPMDSSHFGDCEPNSRKEAMVGYREGYEAARRAEEGKGIKADESGIRVKIPGVDINLPSKAGKAWTCVLEGANNGKSYTGIGPSKAAATKNARTACESELAAVQCGGALECAQNK